MTFTIETEEEFTRLIRKLINDNMPRLRLEDEPRMVELLVTVFNLGMELGREGKVEIIR